MKFMLLENMWWKARSNTRVEYVVGIPRYTSEFTHFMFLQNLGVENYSMFVFNKRGWLIVVSCMFDS